MKKRKVDEIELKRWRVLDAATVLLKLSEHAKQDLTFVPIKNSSTIRLNITVENREFEILCTGSKFYDTRAEKGGGGAIDLVMHLCKVNFRKATEILGSKKI